MCTNPILIRNRKYRHLDVDIKSSYVSVPCGSCDECLRRRANDLYVRARHEFLDCLLSGGCGFMCCLTYNDQQLPFIEHLGKKYMVFNKKHIIDYIKRLRINLERFYQSNFKCSAPKFKYLVTSEYGSDPTRSHRPHYHLLFFFQKSIPLFEFRQMFEKSIYKKVGKKKIAVFGKIFQCDLLDPKRGGIKYSGKYILKDLMFESQRNIILDKINFYKEYVNNLFNVVSLPQTSEQEFRNRCIRSSKEYRKAIALYVRPYSHMLQFYMLSNDLGISAIIRQYGENIINLPFLNFEGFPFALPKLVKQRISENYGSKKSDELNKRIFTNFLKRAFTDLVNNKQALKSETDCIFQFADKYIFPISGNFYLVNPNGLDIRQHIENGASLADYDVLIQDNEFFDANDFFVLRNQLLHLLALYDSDENRMFRAKLAKQKTEREREEYVQKKRNRH